MTSRGIARLYVLVDPRVPLEFVTLEDPDGPERIPAPSSVKYVGVTVRALEVRLRAHLAEARRPAGDNRRLRGIRKMRRECGVEPSIVEIDIVPAAFWSWSERALVAWYKREGARLWNSCAGGLGTLDPTPGARAAHAAAMARPETKAAHSAGIKAALSRPDVKERHAEANRVKVAKNAADPAWRAAVSVGVKAAWARPGAKEARSAAVSGEKNPMKRPGARERHSAAMRAAYGRPETKAAHAAAAVKNAADPTFGARVSAGRRRGIAHRSAVRAVAAGLFEACCP